MRKTLDPPREKETKGEKNYITPAGYHNLTTELDFLQTKKRPEVVSARSDAAAEGAAKLTSVRVPSFAWNELVAEELLFNGLAAYPQTVAFQPLLAAIDIELFEFL